MELRIRDSNNIIDEQFGRWLTERVKTKLLSNISRYRFVNWDTYLTESKQLKRLYNRSYTVAEIVIFAASNISYVCVPGEITISLNNTKFVPGFDRLSLQSIAKTINYGTLDIKGCPIFTDTFDYFAKNIDLYTRAYYRF